MKYFILILKLALDAIFHNKARAFLTMLGIIIGVSSVIAVMSIGGGAQSLITNSIKQVGTDILRVLPGASDEQGPPASAFGITITTLTEEDAQELENIPFVRGVVAYITGNGEISYQNRSFVRDFTGVTDKYQFVENHNVDQGRFFHEQEAASNAKVAVIGQDIKEDLFPLSNAVGQRIKINKLTFKVIGVLEKKESSLFQNYDQQILIPLSTAQKLLLGVKHVSLVSIKIDSEDKVEVTKERVRQKLRERHDIEEPENEDFSVRAPASAIDTFNQITGALTFFLAAIAAVSLLVGGVSITNIMYMTVKERTREIGLRKAIGAKPMQIRNQFILEAIVITTIGGVLGIIAGLIISFLVSVGVNFLGYNWDFIITADSVFLSFTVSVFIGVLFGYLPAKKASQLKPIDALRYE